MDIFRQAIVLCSMVLALSALSGCAVRPLVLNHVADALAMPGQDLEDDILLAREASAFYLKVSESVLREAPGNLKLAESVSSGFTQYAYAFVSFEADQLQSKDAKAAQRMKERAARLYARAHGHAMRALEKTTPGFTKALMQAQPSASLRLSAAQVGVAYWAAASWGGGDIPVQRRPGQSGRPACGHEVGQIGVGDPARPRPWQFVEFDGYV